MIERLSLPAEVVARLELTEPRSGLVCVHNRATVTEERFAIAPVELRTSGAEDTGILGYASTTDVPYDVAGGPALGGWVETMARGAFDKTLQERDDVRLLVNHEGLPLARTASGSLTLSADSLGLLTDAPSLDMRNPKVQEVRSVLERKDADQMSIAFRVTRQEWNDDYTERTIREVKLYDVSIVTYPANPATAVGLRDEQPDEQREETGMPLSLARAQADMLARF